MVFSTSTLDPFTWFLQWESAWSCSSKLQKKTSSWKFFRVRSAEGNTYTCCSKQINKLELAVFTSTFGLPLIFTWIPFTTDSYGPSGTWCWIRSLEDDCSQHTAGLWEQLWLSRVPFILVAVITLALFVTALFLLGCAIKNAKLAKKFVVKLGIADSLLSLALLFFLYMMYLPPQGIITSNSFNRNRFVVWIFIAISTPFVGTLTPLALLVVIHLPLSAIFCACCKQQRYTLVHKSVITTMNKPQYTKAATGTNQATPLGIHRTVQIPALWNYINIEPSKVSFCYNVMWSCVNQGAYF